MNLYHGTRFQNINKLEPFATQGNAISKPVICFTPSYCTALLYIWNRPYKWVTFSEEQNGKVVFVEHYENMLYDFYNNVSGSIYECDGDNSAIVPTHMKGVYTSEVSVSVNKEIQIDNVYDEILKQESSGNITVQRYARLSSEDKNEIFKQTVRAIHMQKLLIASDYLPKQELVRFVQSRFPQAWELASKMTDKEIDQMINEWRASLKKA
ncbi:MAG: hypothetical protein IJC50_00745 [Clostridia bacterium]|nr:hypothetical protein [Clostridia bacterium]